MPEGWQAFDIHYRYHQSVYHLHIRNVGVSGGKRVVTRVVCDGAEQPDKTIPLWDDGREHGVEVEVGQTDR